MTWEVKYLSIRDVVTLVKVMLEPINIFFMSLMMVVTKILESIIMIFFFNSTQDHRKVHLLLRETICFLKKVGGLGLGSITWIIEISLKKWMYMFGNEARAL